MQVLESFGQLEVLKIDVVGLSAKIYLKFITSKTDPTSKPCFFTLIYQDRPSEVINHPGTYWINKTPDSLVNSATNFSVVNNTIITIPVQIHFGKLINNRYTQKIKVQMFKSTESYPELLWQTPYLDVFTAEIIYPEFKYKNSFIEMPNHVVLRTEFNIDWDRDSDFNYHSKAMYLRTIVRNYATGKTLVNSGRININHNYIVIPYGNMPKYYSYEIIHELVSISGEVLKTYKEIAIRQEKSLQTYIVDTMKDLSHIREIKAPENIYIKTSNGIKRVVEIEVK